MYGTEAADAIWTTISGWIPPEKMTEVAIDLIDALEITTTVDLSDSILWMVASEDDDFVLSDIAGDLDGIDSLDAFTTLLDEYGYDYFKADRIAALYVKAASVMADAGTE